MVDQSAHTQRPAVPGGQLQRVAAPHRVGAVDRGAGGDQLVDHLEPLMVRRHDQGEQPFCRVGGGQGPSGDVTCSRSLHEIGNLRPGGDEQVDDGRHSEHRRVQQGGAAGDAARARRGGPLQVGPGRDQSLRHLDRAVAGCRDQRRLGVLRFAVDGCARGQQGLGQGAGARDVAPAVTAGVEAQHGDVAQRRSAQGVVAPLPHRVRRQRRVLPQHGGEAAGVHRVEDLPSGDLGLQPGPTREAVTARQCQLRRSQRHAR